MQIFDFKKKQMHVYFIIGNIANYSGSTRVSLPYQTALKLKGRNLSRTVIFCTNNLLETSKSHLFHFSLELNGTNS